MKHVIPVIIALTTLLPWLPALADSASAVFAKASPSVVVVLNLDAKAKPIALGSGIVLPGDIVVTNCHVIKDGQIYRVRYAGKDYPAKLRDSDWQRDVCSLNVTGLKAPPVALGNTTTLKVGDTVYAIGTPEGLELSLSEGIISSLRNLDLGRYIQTTAAISHGSSGGGLFDDKGRLLGLTSFFVEGGEQLNFALPVEWIEALPQRSVKENAPDAESEVAWLNRAAVLETNKDWAGLLDLSKHWTSAQPHSLMAWILLGEAYSNLSQYSNGIQAYQHALQIDPQDASAWADLGSVYGKSGDLPKAFDAERQALRIDPQNANAWGNLGAAYGHSGDLTKAIDAERKALRINPKDGEVWGYLGALYKASGDSFKAIDAYRKALRIDPKYVEAWVGLGGAYTQTYNLSEAIDAEQHALRIDPKNGLAWFYLGIAYQESRDEPKAIDAEQHALRINPIDGNAWAYLGFFYIGSDDYPKAIAAEQTALRINPQDDWALYYLGMAYYDNKQDAEATQVYQKLKILSPKRAEVFYNFVLHCCTAAMSKSRNKNGISISFEWCLNIICRS